jgi:hypothetical protein
VKMSGNTVKPQRCPSFELDGALKAAAAERKMLFLWPVFDTKIQTEKG